MSIFYVSPFSCRKRNSARLDLLTTMLNQQSHKRDDSDSPHDSLSPLDNVSEYEFNDEAKRFSFEGFPNGQSWLSSLRMRLVSVIILKNGEAKANSFYQRKLFPTKSKRCRMSTSLARSHKQNTRLPQNFRQQRHVRHVLLSSSETTVRPTSLYSKPMG